ncbi:MAG: hypothetical protein ACREQ5_15405 [Candidatus Dormibacteria bacterium]
MSRRPPHPGGSAPPDRRWRDWDCMQRLGVDGQPERSSNYRPGQRS